MRSRYTSSRFPTFRDKVSIALGEQILKLLEMNKCDDPIKIALEYSGDSWSGIWEGQLTKNKTTGVWYIKELEAGDYWFREEV